MESVTTAKQGRKGSVSYSKFFPVTEEVIREHLLGRQTIGIYPLLQDDSCWFVAVDFDKSAWQADAGAFSVACREAGVPAALERSRSGNGAHVWIFFSEPVQAAFARKLATALLTRTMERHYAMGLDSYDRLFPSQDTMPKGGFGNLIALPLQRGPREKGNSLFVDEQLLPYQDQWAFLSSLRRLAPDEVRALLRDAIPTGDAVNIRRISSDDDETSDPWTLSPSGPPAPRAISEPLPARVSISLGNQVYVEKK